MLAQGSDETSAQGTRRRRHAGRVPSAHVVAADHVQAEVDLLDAALQGTRMASKNLVRRRQDRLPGK